MYVLAYGMAQRWMTFSNRYSNQWFLIIIIEGQINAIKQCYKIYSNKQKKNCSFFHIKTVSHENQWNLFFFQLSIYFQLLWMTDIVSGTKYMSIILYLNSFPIIPNSYFDKLGMWHLLVQTNINFFCKQKSTCYLIFFALAFFFSMKLMNVDGKLVEATLFLRRVKCNAFIRMQHYQHVIIGWSMLVFNFLVSFPFMRLVFELLFAAKTSYISYIPSNRLKWGIFWTTQKFCVK